MLTVFFYVISSTDAPRFVYAFEPNKQCIDDSEIKRRSSLFRTCFVWEPRETCILSGTHCCCRIACDKPLLACGPTFDHVTYFHSGLATVVCQLS